jgi:predicted small metal-binding protein
MSEATPETRKHLRCRDVGMDCDFEMHGASDEDVMQQAAAHAAREHGIREITPDLASRVRAAIRAD